MNGQETLTLWKMVRAAVPAQEMDEDALPLWAMALHDVRLVDAQQALVNLMSDNTRKNGPWISPADVRGEVKRIRGARITAFGPLPEPPLEVETGARSYREWQAECQRRIADGEVTDPAQLPHRPRGGLAVEPGTFAETFRAIAADPFIPADEPQVVTGKAVES